MTHPALSQKYSLHLLPKTTAQVVCDIQAMIQQDDVSDQLRASYPLLFMGDLTMLQRRQVIAFLEATPLRSKSKTCTMRLAHPSFWRFWIPKEVPTKLRLSWVDEKQTFVPMPVLNFRD